MGSVVVSFFLLSGTSLCQRADDAVACGVAGLISGVRRRGQVDWRISNAAAWTGTVVIEVHQHTNASISACQA